jgi:hypothetical protein
MVDELISLVPNVSSNIHQNNEPNEFDYQQCHTMMRGGRRQEFEYFNHLGIVTPFLLAVRSLAK